MPIRYLTIQPCYIKLFVAITNCSLEFLKVLIASFDSAHFFIGSLYIALQKYLFVTLLYNLIQIFFKLRCYKEVNLNLVDCVYWASCIEKGLLPTGLPCLVSCYATTFSGDTFLHSLCGCSRCVFNYCSINHTPSCNEFCPVSEHIYQGCQLQRQTIAPCCCRDFTVTTIKIVFCCYPAA